MEMVERLSKSPAPDYSLTFEDPPPPPRVADPQTIKRLVENSIERGRGSQDDDEGQSYRPVMDPESRKIAAESTHPTGDLFEHSVRLEQQMDDLRKQTRKHNERMELAECSFQPRFTSSPPQFGLPVHIPGSTDHIERLAVARQRAFEREHFFDGESTSSPAERVLGSKRRTPDDTRKVNDVLAEVDFQLSKFRASPP
jgi:hypothetical protein